MTAVAGMTGGGRNHRKKVNHMDNEKVIALKQNSGVNGSVMVVGGGITGMQAALDLAESGYFVHLVEQSPAIGGTMAQLDKTFPTNDCSM